MGRPKGSKTTYFSKVLEARQALAESAMEIFELNMTMLRESIACQDFRAAGEHLRFMLDRITDAEGNYMIEGSIDKLKELKAAGPTIQIGIALGVPPKQLPPPPEIIVSSPERMVDGSLVEKVEKVDRDS